MRCVVRVISSQPLTFSQTDKFSTPPTERYEGAANQWHLTVGTTRKAAEVKFLALAVPFRNTEPVPRIELVEDGSWRGFTVNGEKIIAWWGEGEISVQDSVRMKVVLAEGEITHYESK